MTQEEKIELMTQLLQSGRVEIKQLSIGDHNTFNYHAAGKEATKTGFTDEQIARAIEAINGKGKAIDSKQKMAAVYWYLRWAAGWPVGTQQFCDRMNLLPFGQQLAFPCDYRNIRDWTTLSFMHEDARQMEKVRYSKNDAEVFYQCREVVMALENALKSTPD